MAENPTHKLTMYYDGTIGAYYARIKPPLESHEWLTGHVALHPSSGRRGEVTLTDTAFLQSQVRNPDGIAATEYIALDVVWPEPTAIAEVLSEALVKAGVVLNVDQDLYSVSALEG